MTTQEIFSCLGAVLDKYAYCFEKLANVGDFLNYRAFKRMGEYYSLWCGYADRNLDRFEISKYCNFPVKTASEKPDMVPQEFYYSKKDSVTPRERMRFARWLVDETYEYLCCMLKVFEKAYCDFSAIGEIHTAIFLKCFIEDLGCEIKYLLRHKLEYENVEYMPHHMERIQESLHDCYQEKTEALKVGIK